MHIGHNVERLRNYRRISQRDMAKRLEMDHKQYTELVQSEEIPDYMLTKIGAELDFDPEYIRWWADGGTTNNQYINDTATGHQDNHGCTNNQIINPLDKIVELYDRLLKAEQEKVAQLQGELQKRTS